MGRLRGVCGRYRGIFCSLSLGEINRAQITSIHALRPQNRAMENMQDVTAALNTAALNALGVKTCLACGKAGAKSLCMGCKTVYFCGKACQTQAWPGHKRECRRIVRERARVLDAAAADYAADEARAAEACRAA